MTKVCICQICTCGKKRVCICQICNCRRHRCPHHPKPPVRKGDQPCLLSEYTNRYIKHPLEQRKPFRPVEQPHQNAGPLEDKTTNRVANLLKIKTAYLQYRSALEYVLKDLPRVDYVPHPLEKPHVHQPERYTTPDGQFDHLTNYTKDFTKKEVPRARPAKPDYSRKTPGKFEGMPTYTDDYRKWPLTRREPVVRDAGYRPSSAPFEGQTNYQGDYTAHKAMPRSSMKPAENAKMSDQPFDDQTGYRTDYIKHPLPPREPKQSVKWSPNKQPLDGLTNYMKDFVPKKAAKMASCRPEGGAYQSDAPFDGDTTQRIDYQKWPTQRPFVHEHEAYHKPDGDFDFNTTSHIAYDKKPLQRVKAHRPEARKSAPGRFDGNTNYNTDYRKWTPVPRVQPKVRADYVPPEAAFEGQSNYVSDYIKHKAMPRQSMRPVENAKMSDQPFDGTTGYRDDYIKHPLQRREKPEEVKWAPNPSKLDGLTNYMKDYTEKQAPKMASCRPEGGAYRSDAPFDDDTTHRVDYKKWPTNKPALHEPEQYRKPDGDFDFNTTSHVAYDKKPLQARKAIRPPSRQREPGKFSGVTNYTEDYRKWGITPRQAAKTVNPYMAPEVPFEGRTNYQDDYTKKRAPPRSSMKPAEQGVGSGKPFDGTTMYRTDYVPKEVPPCPAAIIETARTQYVFREQDPTGHKWYEPRPMSSSITAKLEVPTMSQQPMPAMVVA